jgi:hypothetical protein
MKQLIRKPHQTNDGCKEFIKEISHLGSMKPTVTGGKNLLTVKNNTRSSTELASSCCICFFIVILVGEMSSLKNLPLSVSF